MGDLKNLLKSIENESEEYSGAAGSEGDIEVLADSLNQALELASKELKVDLSMLDYEIIEKGTKGFAGVGRRPYKLVVRTAKVSDKYKDLLEIDKKLSHVTVNEEDIVKIDENTDGEFKVRVTKSGIWLTVTSPKKKGKKVDTTDVMTQFYSMRIENADNSSIEKAVKSHSGKPVRVGEWIPNPDIDGSMSVEVSDDEMKAYIHFSEPRFSGRHMEVDDILELLKEAGVVTGVDEKGIEEYLERMDYTESLIAAKGSSPKHGKDAYVDYKVRIDKSQTVFEEDEKGQVDFKDLDLLENVVVGQLLAIKVPAEEGVQGRTLTNRVLPARSGKDIVLRHGKGTILSEDGFELTAEINGQVVFNAERVSVEPVHLVKGDVSLQTGNIVFLGSVVITGNVQDNFVVKAAGNIEVKGSVQKAFLEAEGNIIVKQGIVGREEAKIESTGGTVYAKFIQTATVLAERDVIVSEGIIHSHVDAGERILCNGRKAKIVGGVIRAAEEVNARFLGSDSFTKTEVRVGVNPKVLQQIVDLRSIRKNEEENINKVKLDLNTLTVQKKNSGGYLPPDKEEMHNKLIMQKQKLTGRLNEIGLELEELKGYLSMLGHKGKICAEKNIFPGVDVYVKEEKFAVKDPYSNIKFTLENDEIRLSEYEAPDFDQEQFRALTSSRRR